MKERPGVIEADWPAPGSVHAFTTLRSGGFSKGPWSSLNLGEHCGDLESDVARNRRALTALLPSSPRWMKQIHGTAVQNLDSGVRTPGEIRADAQWTRRSNTVCSVLTADCLPVVFCTRQADRVAVAHAGWRGLAAGVLENTVLALQKDPGDILAWMGPAIGPKAFEVGEDVVEAFPEEFPGAFARHGDRWLMDLYKAAR